MGRPNPPTHITIDGDPETPNLATKAMGSVTIKGKVTDSDGGPVSMVIRYQKVVDGKEGRVHEERSDRVPSGHVATLVLKDLGSDVKYVAKAFTADSEGKISFQHTPDGPTGYNSLSWWMNRRAQARAISPVENAQVDPSAPTIFDWTYDEPDPGSFGQQKWELRWRRAATAARQPGKWETRDGDADTSAKTIDEDTFKENLTYEWQARGKDAHDLWARWSLPRSFSTIGLFREPRIDHPRNDETVVATEDNEFFWRFRDPVKTDTQVKADIRYRAVGAPDWTVLVGDEDTIPAEDESWVIPAGAFMAGLQYEWEVRTYDASSGGILPSQWSEPETFIAVPAGDPLPIIDTDADDPITLGCGTHRAFLFSRGGIVQRGEIKPLKLVRYNRQRDEIGGATIVTNNFGLDCGELLKGARCWMHELVIYRYTSENDPGTRVFEGPITRITYKRDQVEIEAKDVMAYPYRRIMRQGYNDSYRKTKKGRQLGLLPVTERAAKILQNCLAYDDPNLLSHLAVIRQGRDAKQSRVVPDYAKTAHNEIDDLAMNAGLDYTVLGRRIILWDTHNPIGKLPEMNDKHFAEALIVSEYGMLACNHFGVTDGTGVFGVAKPVGTYWHNNPVDDKVDQFEYYGPVEMLASSYGSAGNNHTGARTEQREQRARRVAVYAEQAQRNISDRWPTPLVVRLPDNSAMMPDCPVGINHLVPGVWIPLRAEETLRQVAGWQKLDRVEVTETEGKEEIRVTMSGAPNGGNDDPDADAEGDDL